MSTKTPRFAATSCSNCGHSFGPGDHGYSHCDQHQSPEVWIPDLIRNYFDKAPDLGKASYPAFENEWDDGADYIARNIIGRFAERYREVLDASQELITRWETPAWKNAEPTARAIGRLRAALARARGETR